MNDNSATSKQQAFLICFFVFVYLASLFTYVIIARKGFFFDDAFITYRYAKNLADGAGIVWNVGDSPVEGYTNFLLVIILSPFIKAGFSPFIISQLLGILAIAATLILLFYTGITFYKMDKFSAFLSSAIILHPLSAYVAMLGLETCLYTLGLTIVLISFNNYLREQKGRYLSCFGLSSLATFWLRPEGALLVIICIGSLFFFQKSSDLRKTIMPLCLTLFLPLLAYFVWKHYYFGYLLPNPFHLKVASGFFKPRSVADLKYYSLNMIGLLPFVLYSYVCCDQNRAMRIIITTFVLVFIIFFLQVDTLMGTFQRFYYPLTPFLIILALPALKVFFNKLRELPFNLVIKLVLTLIIIAVITGPKIEISDEGLSFAAALSWQNTGNNPEVDLSTKEYQVALKLAQFEEIKQMTIALPDTGIIPYYTEAKVLDVVGLNDPFIARERSIPKLIDYYFSQKPDLAFLPSINNTEWMKIGHGPLGNYNHLARDKRWRNYFYCGSINVILYDYHLFVRNDYPQAQELQWFLIENVIDFYQRPFTLPIG